LNYITLFSRKGAKTAKNFKARFALTKTPSRTLRLREIIIINC